MTAGEEKTSAQKLVEALKTEHNPKLKRIIARAERGEYSDTLSQSATPIMDLVKALRGVGCEGLARRAMAGEFDATKAEWDTWSASEEGQQAFRNLIGP